MEYSILLFGIAREIVGDTAVSMRLKSGATVLDVKQHLITEFPEFSRLKSVLVAVNNEYAEDDRALSDTDEIALIPPVSGG